jgi:predicted permease
VNNTLLAFGLIILTGAAFRRFRFGGIDADVMRGAINASVLNLFLPALCIKTVYASAIDISTVLVPLTAGITILLSLAMSLLVYSLLEKRMHMTQQEKGVLILAAAFGNVTYLGLPVLTSLYGAEAAKYALFYDLLATTPILWLVGASLAARYGEGKKLSIRESLSAIASLPPLWGIFGGMVLQVLHVPLPPFMVIALGMLGGLVVPLMIFSIGLALTVPRVTHAMAVIPAVVIKLAVAPFISLGVAYLLGLKGVALASCLLEGAMPAMVLSLLIAARFRLDISLSAFTIVITTALSFFTLPAAIYLAGQLTG